MASKTKVVEAPEEVLNRQYAEAKLEMVISVNRRDALHTKGKTLEGLTDSEELELLRLERRVTNLTPALEALQRRMFLKDAEMDLEAILADWHALVEEKKKAYGNFYNAIAHLKQAHGVLMAVHQLQEQTIGRLPGEIIQRLGFPSVGQFEANMLARLPNGRGWQGGFGPPESCPLPNPAQVEDPDPGTRDISPRLIERLQKDYRLWKEGLRSPCRPLSATQNNGRGP